MVKVVGIRAFRWHRIYGKVAILCIVPMRWVLHAWLLTLTFRFGIIEIEMSRDGVTGMHHHQCPGKAMLRWHIQFTRYPLSLSMGENIFLPLCFSTSTSRLSASLGPIHHTQSVQLRPYHPIKLRHLNATTSREAEQALHARTDMMRDRGLGHGLRLSGLLELGDRG